ncbi:SapC family protein [Gilvimarinus japonicus]|uniref:SapC family protein n=1 Tax=Gilvimarinus japonicus TaxID=1796469 RepID=A0ABV7HRN7_9GAMM
MSRAAEVLDSTKHKKLRVLANCWADQCYQCDSVNVVISELQNLVHEYPILIAKNPTSGRFQLRALLGLGDGKNLYVQDGIWRAGCYPLEVLSRPFRLCVPDANASAAGVIAVEPDSELFSEEEGEPLFQEDGSPSAMLQRITQVFSALLNGQQQSEDFLARLHKWGLIEPVSIGVTLNDGTQKALEGLYGINEDSLKALPDEALSESHKNGDLYAIHLILSSSVHIEKLARWQ